MGKQENRTQPELTVDAKLTSASGPQPHDDSRKRPATFSCWMQIWIERPSATGGFCCRDKGPKMTIMVSLFFCIAHAAVRLRMPRDLPGFATKLYVALCHESEPYSGQELTQTVAQLQAPVGGSRSSNAKARVDLNRAELVAAELYAWLSQGNISRIRQSELHKVIRAGEDPSLPVGYDSASKRVSFNVPIFLFGAEIEYRKQAAT